MLKVMDFYLLLKIWAKILCVNIIKNFLMMLKNQLPTSLKLLQKKQFKKTAEAIGIFKVNKIPDKITSKLKNLESKKLSIEILTERYISPEKGQSNINEHMLI